MIRWRMQTLGVDEPLAHVECFALRESYGEPMDQSILQIYHLSAVMNRLFVCQTDPCFPMLSHSFLEMIEGAAAKFLLD